MTDTVRMGGLRCCLATLEDYYRPAPGIVAAEGQVLECKYCSGSMLFRDQAWEWNRDAIQSRAA